MNLRDWQVKAIEAWKQSDRKGVISAATGGGKTLLALTLSKDLNCKFIIIVCPTITLIDQWHGNILFLLNINKNEISRSLKKIKKYILITDRHFKNNFHLISPINTFLILDECHRYATEANIPWLQLNYHSKVGLTATTRRTYDNNFSTIIEKNIGKIIFKYRLRDAVKDKVVVPYHIQNINVPLTINEQCDVDSISHKIAKLKSINEDADIKMLMIQRRRIINDAVNRNIVGVYLVKKYLNLKKIMFCESIGQADHIRNELISQNIACSIYHSKLSKKIRLQNLFEFINGNSLTLIGCKALDEGLDVPDITLGIIVSQSNSDRQRIQRIGRTVRLHTDKESSTVITLYSHKSESDLLQREERENTFLSHNWMRI